METALVNAAGVNLNRDMMAATIFGFGFVPQVVLNFEIAFGINRRFSLIVIKIKNGKYLRIGNMLFIQDFFDLFAGAAGDDMNIELEQIKTTLKRHRGRAQVLIYLPDGKILKTDSDLWAEPSDALRRQLMALVGAENVKVQQ